VVVALDVIIFARYWEPGCIKTRLCPPLTPAQAANISQQCLDLLVQRLTAAARFTTIIAFEPFAARAEFAARYPQATLLPQQGDGLTAKLQHLLAPRRAPCLITGSDCPTAPLAYFDQAGAALEHGADVVLGPARDGGSYLLGLDAAHADWFRDIPWSTARVSATLRLRARERGWRLHDLPFWYDIDTWEDVVCLCKELARASIFMDILSFAR
jgi:rSAM/selenodomain-associated transferase 1